MKTIGIPNIRITFRVFAAVIAFIMLAVTAGCTSPAAVPEAAEQASRETAEPAPTDEAAPTAKAEPTAEAEQTPFPDDGFTRIARIGTVPEEYAGIVRQDDILFSASVLSDRIVSLDRTMAEDGSVASDTVHVYDLYGKPIASLDVPVREQYAFGNCAETSDGGFIFVHGFFDERFDDGTFASDKPYSSVVTKCDKDGNKVFDAELDSIAREELQFCLEKDGKYYFFGYKEVKCDYHSIDLSALVLSASGEKLAYAVFGGSDADMPWFVRETEDGFELRVSAEEPDGIFDGIEFTEHLSFASCAVTVGDSLNVVNVETCDSVFDYADDLRTVGRLNGETVYRKDLLDAGFDAGTPWKLVDYGSEYLILSQNKIGTVPIYNLSASTKYEVLENVYTLYDRSGNIIFREAFDFNTPEIIKARHPEMYSSFFEKPQP